MKYILLAFSVLFFLTLTAQVGINTSNPKALLDITANSSPLSTDGILIPRMSDFPAVDPNADQDGMLIFINGNGSEAKGFYYWDWEGTSGIWRGYVRGNSLDESYDYSGPGAGREIIADKGSVLISGSDGLEVTGTFGSGLPVQLSGNGTRMFFNPRKSSFRSGTITTGNGFDDVNIGNYSFSHGLNNTASGDFSISMGENNLVSGDNSVSFGFSNQASGIASITNGERNIVSGNASGAFGAENNMSGFASYVFGRNNTVSSNVSFVVGSYNSSTHFRNIVLGQQLETESDIQIVLGKLNLTGQALNSRPIFVIGNGSGVLGRRNAVMVLENGNMGLDNTVPDDAVLQIDTEKDRGIDVNIDTNLTNTVFGVNQKVKSTSTNNNSIYGTFSEIRKEESTNSNMRGLSSSVIDEQNGGGRRNLYGGEFVVVSTNSNGVSRVYAVYGDATGASIADVKYAGYFAGDVHVTGNFTNPSDRKLKTEIKPYSNSLDKLNSLDVHQYYFKREYQKKMGVSSEKQVGFISQEVEQIFPELVKKEVKAEKNDKEGKMISEALEYKSVNYLGMVPHTVQAIKEMSVEIKQLKKENKMLLERLNRLEAKFN